MTHPRRAARDPLQGGDAVRPGKAGSDAYWVGHFSPVTPAW